MGPRTNEHVSNSAHSTSSAQVEKSQLHSEESMILWVLLAFRVANALMLQTFFQPDEYFQSLEPAWDLAFGTNSGAWITWEWSHLLRSSLHPFIFGGLYRIASLTGDIFKLTLSTRADLLIAAPKVLQAVLAAYGDFHLIRLTHRLCGKEAPQSRWILLMVVTSPWQFFFSTRTFSNALETTLTTVALYWWPYHWIIVDRSAKTQSIDRKGPSKTDKGVSLALASAAFATILRPTNILIWIPMTAQLLFYSTNTRRLLFINRALISGVFAIVISALADRLFYGVWALPAWQFYHLNSTQRIADFYGINRADYYLTEGLPLLLCFLPLPFALDGIVAFIRNEMVRTRSSGQRSNMLSDTAACFTVTCLLTIGVFSLINHKEVRFLAPLQPMFLFIAADRLSLRLKSDQSSTKTRTWTKISVAFVISLQIALAFYVSRIHQRGVIDVMHYLRHEHEAKLNASFVSNSKISDRSSGDTILTTVGFLMPCHSTPWRSHLVHPGIKGWALTCNPPLTIPFQERQQYQDEADQFYDDSVSWLDTRMANNIAVNGQISQREINLHQHRWWPEYLVFFEQVEPLLKERYKDKHGYELCWRGFNSQWHDDWRRKGDVIVYCKRS